MYFFLGSDMEEEKSFVGGCIGVQGRTIWLWYSLRVTDIGLWEPLEVQEKDHLGVSRFFQVLRNGGCWWDNDWVWESISICWRDSHKGNLKLTFQCLHGLDIDKKHVNFVKLLRELNYDGNASHYEYKNERFLQTWVVQFWGFQERFMMSMYINMARLISYHYQHCISNSLRIEANNLVVLNSEFSRCYQPGGVGTTQIASLVIEKMPLQCRKSGCSTFVLSAHVCEYSFVPPILCKICCARPRSSPLRDCTAHPYAGWPNLLHYASLFI